MLLRRNSLAILVLCASACAALPARRGGEVCGSGEVRAVQEQADAFDPVGWPVSAMASHDVTIVGEFHRLVPEIRYLGQVIERAAASELLFDVGSELLPAARQSDLDRLVVDEPFDENLYFNIVGDKYHLAPLDVAEYADVARAVWTANRGREAPIRLVGLAPACRLGPNLSREGVIQCLMERDASLAETAKREVLDRGRRLLLNAGSFHAAHRLQDPDGEAIPTTAGLLATDASVASLLLAGPIDDGGQEWGETCGGLFRVVSERLGGRGYVVSLDHGPFSQLPVSCLGADVGGEGRLAEAFDAVVQLSTTAPSPDPTPLDGWAFGAIDPEALLRWDAFRVELMGLEARGDAENWRLETGRELMRFTDKQTARPRFCAEPASP